MITEQAAATNWPSAPKILSLEHNIALGVCFMLLVLGLPGAISGGSILGFVLASIGVAGMVALLNIENHSC